jgi:hypothetical protein
VCVPGDLRRSVAFAACPPVRAQGVLATEQVRCGWQVALVKPIHERLRADGLYDHHQLEDTAPRGFHFEKLVFESESRLAYSSLSH